MKTDLKGRSTCPKGEERFEWFNVVGYAELTGRRIQYDYRTPDGELFSCIAKSLKAARAKRDAWLAQRAQLPEAHGIDPDYEAAYDQWATDEHPKREP